jgi:hypothetical protein
MSISNIELKMSKIISAFFFRVLSGFYQSVILFLRLFPYPELRFLTFSLIIRMTLFMFYNQMKLDIGYQSFFYDFTTFECVCGSFKRLIHQRLV